MQPNNIVGLQNIVRVVHMWTRFNTTCTTIYLLSNNTFLNVPSNFQSYQTAVITTKQGTAQN